MTSAAFERNHGVYRFLEPIRNISDFAGHRVIVQAQSEPGDDRARLKAGLLQPAASIDPKFFYDAQGCALFNAICSLDEYYPTRTEASIFERYRQQIADCLPAHAQWIDLGCGDGVKSRNWIGVAGAKRFVGVDIAHGWLVDALDGMAREYSVLECLGVVTDFSANLTLQEIIAERADWPPVFFYPGSSIGNFTPPDAREFLRSVRDHLGNNGCLLIGVDLVKDPHVLEAAYDDALGITAAFNRNILRAVNSQFGTDFEPRCFDHRATFNIAESRIEMHLRANAENDVRIGDTNRHFACGEEILTEYSHKYSIESFAALLDWAGFSRHRYWTDERGWFGVFLAQP
jgi:dimethylhistidine N-methyltransferase